MSIGKVIECPCGAVIEGMNEETLIATAQDHARQVHEMELSRDQALAMARPI